MQEVFENIINKLEEQKEYYKDIRKNTHCRVTETSECDSCRADHCLDARLRCVDDITEIVKQEAEEYNNGWIPCSERLPEAGKRYLVSAIWKDKDFEKSAVYDAVYGSDGLWHSYNYDSVSYKVIAWQPLPQPYQPKGEING